MGVGGGRGHEMDGRKKGIGRGAAPFLLKSPRGRFGTVMMGWWCVAGGVVLLPPLHAPTPNSSSAPSFSLPHALVTDLYACFVDVGDNQAGPLRRECPAGWACLMSVCLCVFECMCVDVCACCVCF